MHETTINIYRMRLTSGDRAFCNFVEQAQHFHVERDISRLAASVRKQEALAADEDKHGMIKLLAPVSAKLPCQKLLMTLDGMPGSVVILHSLDGGRVDVKLATVTQTVDLGQWEPGGDYFRAENSPFADDNMEFASQFVIETAYQLSLINEPRVVERSDRKPSRQYRRQMERNFEHVPVGWSVVEWRLGGKTKPKGDIGTGGHRKALHWRRGHWVRCNSDHPRAEWVEFKLRESGWFYWRQDSWCGHPDYGVKLADKKPFIGDSRKAKTGGFVPSRPTNEKLAAMDGAKRAALIQAGFA